MDFVDLVIVFGWNSNGLQNYSFLWLRRFTKSFWTNSLAMSLSSGRYFFARFVYLPNGFRRNSLAAVAVPLLAISSVFLRFFDESRLRRFISWKCWTSSILPMLFGRITISAVHPDNSANSLCFPIEIRETWGFFTCHPFCRFRYVFLSNFVSGHHKQNPVDSRILGATIRPLGCSDFVVLLMLFGRIE